MSRLLQRLARAVKRRPVRVLEAVLALAAALGVTVGPELVGSAEAIVGVLAAVGIVGGEAAQLKTRSKDYVADRFQDAETGGPPGDDAEPREPTDDTLGAVPDAIYGER